MRDIISFFPKETLEKAVSLFNNKNNVVFSGSGNSSSKAMVLSQILKDKKNNDRSVIWVVSEPSEQNMVKKAMMVWSDRDVYVYKKRENEEVIGFPSSSDFERTKRLELLEFVSRLIIKKGAVFVLDFKTLLQKFPSPTEINKNKIKIKKGEKLEVVAFIENLVSIGYENTDEDVLSKGSYYRRGDSIFINPINNEEVFRIDIDFDNVSEINVVEDGDYSKTTKKELAIPWSA